MPCTLGLIEGTPVLKSDPTMGVVIAEYRILYDKFDNMAAAGK